MEGEAQLVISGDQQLVLSASDAAQLLAQAGIQLSDSEQVIIGSEGAQAASIPSVSGGECLPSEEEVAAALAGEGHGEILYIDPNDPQAAALLQQAGLALAPDGTVQPIETINENAQQQQQQQQQLEEAHPQQIQQATAEEASSSAASLLHHQQHQQHQQIQQIQQQHHSGNNAIPNSQINAKGLLPLVPDKPTALLEAAQKQQILTSEGILQQSVEHHLPEAAVKPILESHQSIQPPAKKEDKPPPARHQSSSSGATPQQVVQVGPDQQQVMYSVTSEDGKTQQYMMLCPKEMDQQTLIRTLVKQITSDPNNRGRKTIRITKQKSNNSVPKAQKTRQRRLVHPPARSSQQQQQQQLQQQVQQQQQQRVHQQPNEPADLLGSALMAIENTKEGSLETGGGSSSGTDFLSSTGEPQPIGDPSATRVFVRCNYCSDFRTILNSETWESILNHILPVAKEELHTTFYGDLSKHFVRTLRIQVNGRQIVKTGTLMIPQCEVILTHSLICLKTKKEFLLDKPNANFVADLAKHIKNTQFGTTNRSNSLLCVFCNSPYTYEDYLRHVTPHQDAILATLNCFAGAYCASSYEGMMKHPSCQDVCNICQEVEQADLRFQPCTKFSSEYNCNKKLQFAIDCFREKYGDNGFMRLNTSSVTRCSVCKNSQNVYCAVFHISTTVLSEETQEVHDLDSQLCVCINCQKQFINIVMKEQEFEKKLKLFQLKNMEQLCSCLRVILNQATPVCQQKNALIYTVQENLSNPTASIHSVRTADVAEVMPITKLMALSETDITTSRIKASYQCDLCGFYIDLTSLISNPNQTQKNDMILGVVLEHMVPHTESLIGVITSSAANQTFNLKFEVMGRVSEAAGVRKIHLSLQRKFKSASSNMEIPLDKDEEKTMLQIRAGVKSERKNYVAVRSSISSITNNKVLNKLESSANQLIEVNKFIERQRGKFSLLAICGCNTTLLSLYAECRLCSKFSYPDFRLCGILLSSVDLCENCVDTVLTLCLPTEPEVLANSETCLLLGEEKSVGHRLVLSNNLKKWLSIDGVNLIKKTVEEYEDTKLFDTSALLLSALRKHLVAALRKCWLDSSVMTVAAGFCVTDTFLAGSPEVNTKKPEEVKVKILAKKDVAPPPGGGGSKSLSVRSSNNSSISRSNGPPVRRRVIISNGSRVVNLAEAQTPTVSASTVPATTASDKEEEESVSAIQSFLEQTSSSSKNSSSSNNAAASLLDDVKVPAGIKITAAGKGVVNIRAIAESRVSGGSSNPSPGGGNKGKTKAAGAIIHSSPSTATTTATVASLSPTTNSTAAITTATTTSTDAISSPSTVTPPAAEASKPSSSSPKEQSELQSNSSNSIPSLPPTAPESSQPPTDAPSNPSPSKEPPTDALPPKEKEGEDKMEEHQPQDILKMEETDTPAIITKDSSSNDEVDEDRQVVEELLGLSSQEPHPAPPSTTSDTINTTTTTATTEVGSDSDAHLLSLETPSKKKRLNSQGECSSSSGGDLLLEGGQHESSNSSSLILTPSNNSEGGNNTPDSETNSRSKRKRKEKKIFDL